MPNHRAGHRSYIPTTVLHHHLLDRKLRDIDITPQICTGQRFEILFCSVNDFVKKIPALLTTPSIEPKVTIAFEAISRAVEGSPMSPRTTASRSVLAKLDAVMLSELATTFE
jgi:hypothetical protein